MKGVVLVFTPEQAGQMVTDARKRYPVEACGLVAGRAGRVEAVFPVENVLDSPVRFQMSPQEQISLLLMFEEKGWDLAAVYHSHPHGPPRPSITDIEECAYPDAVQIILFPAGQDFEFRGFYIRGKKVTQARIEIEMEPSGTSK